MNLLRVYISILYCTIVVTFKAYDSDRFEREVLVTSSRDAIQFEVLGNGDIVFVEIDIPPKGPTCDLGAIAEDGSFRRELGQFVSRIHRSLRHRRRP